MPSISNVDVVYWPQRYRYRSRIRWSSKKRCQRPITSMSCGTTCAPAVADGTQLVQRGECNPSKAVRCSHQSFDLFVGVPPCGCTIEVGRGSQHPGTACEDNDVGEAQRQAIRIVPLHRVGYLEPTRRAAASNEREGSGEGEESLDAANGFYQPGTKSLVSTKTRTTHPIKDHDTASPATILHAQWQSTMPRSRKALR